MNTSRARVEACASYQETVLVIKKFKIMRHYEKSWALQKRVEKVKLDTLWAEATF